MAEHSPAEESSLRPVPRAQIIRRAILQPARYLAAALAELPDEDLAAACGAAPARVWLLRLCRYPRAERWAADVAVLAALVDASAWELQTLLRRVGITPGGARRGGPGGG
jgi:hypothetical protein